MVGGVNIIRSAHKSDEESKVPEEPAEVDAVVEHARFKAGKRTYIPPVVR